LGVFDGATSAAHPARLRQAAYTLHTRVRERPTNCGQAMNYRASASRGRQLITNPTPVPVGSRRISGRPLAAADQLP